VIIELSDTLRIVDAAKEAGYTPNGLRYWIGNGTIATVRTPLGRLVIRESLQEFLESRAERHSETAER
jgi:predicted site-specific integrase-resolvase